MRFLSLLLLIVPLFAEEPIRGFAARDWRAERQREAKACAVPSPERIGGYIRRMSAQPHEAGSPRSKAVAEYALGLMRGWGLDARIEEFEALLPRPTERVLEMTAPVKFRARLAEPAIAEDPDSAGPDQLPTYNAYSASGDVTAGLVYVNYGVQEDYETLAKLGIDVKGKIVIARYGRSWRGIKPKLAREHGAIGCLLYSDPRDGGYFSGDVYPQGPYRPNESVQRGSVMRMEMYPGDPLSPGWASEKGSRRLALSEAGTLVGLPVLPISAADAEPLLRNLGGPVAPEEWRGALPLTYHLGPGAMVHLKLDFDWATRPVYDVVARIPGGEHPEQWVLYGNHHDAWVRGAEDPGSGAAALLETARALAELRRNGWQPRRSIVLALWDAEEFGLIGSTEWVEKHAAELDQSAVAYLNTDMAGKGRASIGGSHLLEQFSEQVLRDVQDPETRGSVLAASLRQRDGRSASQFHVAAAGAGSDYTAFLHHLGISSLNVGFSGPGSGGVYHSIYDSYAWYSRFGDPGFQYIGALARVMTTATLRLADAPLVPLEFDAFARTAGEYVEEVRKLGKDLDLTAVRAELDKMRRNSAAFETRQKAALEAGSPEKLAAANRILARMEKVLLSDAGLPGRAWYKHQIYAPGLYTGYAAKTLPGVREALEAGHQDEGARQVRPLLEALRRLNARIEELTRAL